MADTQSPHPSALIRVLSGLRNMRDSLTDARPPRNYKIHVILAPIFSGAGIPRLSTVVITLWPRR